jgi:hypothetical protein
MRRDSRRRGDWCLGFPSEGKGMSFAFGGGKVLSFLDVSKSAILDWVFLRSRIMKGKVNKAIA